MNKISIGILDVEEEYVLALVTYLQRYGKGKWNVFGFTELESLKMHLAKHRVDLLIGTNWTDLRVVCIENIIAILLLDDAYSSGERIDENIYVTKRFQKAREIGKMAEAIIRQREQEASRDVTCVAIYSPVGRCGKTELALDLVKSNVYGKWMYLGLEDYGSFGQMDENTKADEAIYFWKERKADALLEVVKQLEGVLGTGTSLFDRKQLEEEDYRWLKEEGLKDHYTGIIFDLGSGAIKNTNVLNVFDHIVVPYISEASAMQKKQRFEWMLEQCGMEGVLARCHFVCMDNSPEVEHLKEMIFEGVGG